MEPPDDYGDPGGRYSFKGRAQPVQFSPDVAEPGLSQNYAPREGLSKATYTSAGPQSSQFHEFPSRPPSSQSPSYGRFPKERSFSARTSVAPPGPPSIAQPSGSRASHLHAPSGPPPFTQQPGSHLSPVSASTSAPPPTLRAADDPEYGAYIFPELSPDSEDGAELLGSSAVAPPDSSAEPTKPDKGKKRAIDPPSDSRLAPTVKKAKATAKDAEGLKSSKSSKQSGSSESSRPGRQQGSANYNETDLCGLLDAVRTVMPSGPDAWARVASTFNQWAADNGRPTRTEKAIRSKYDELVRKGSGKKPTGTAEIAWYFEEAVEIEQELRAKQEFGEDTLEDGNEADGATQPGESEAQDDRVPDPSSRASSSQRSRSTPSTSTDNPTRDQIPFSSRRRQAQTQQFLNTISACLDPSAREARDEARYARRLAQDEINRLAQENRDLRTRNETLMDRIQALTLQLQQQTTEVARLQSRLDMYEMMTSMFGRPQAGFAPPSSRSASVPPFPWSAPQWDDVTPQRHPPAPSGSMSASPSARRSSFERTASHAPRPHTPSNAGLETLASVASTSRHGDDGSLRSSSITLTFTPTRRRTQNVVDD
ncbi:hypothetical protein OH77DRAFT_1593754, partial [Trametes cingulata]